MATMTISEAEHIINITVAALLEEQTSSNGEDQKNHFLEYYCHKPISTLQGYDVFQIDIALKLRLANMFLFLAEKNGFKERFAEEIRICTLPILPLRMFIPDDLMAKLEQLTKLSKTLPQDSPEFMKRKLPVIRELAAFKEWPLKDKKFLSLETSASFGEYCRCVGANDPIYWQKVYTRIGIEYTSTSPKGNTPVYTETN